jgi:hypothetical protein
MSTLPVILPRSGSSAHGAMQWAVLSEVDGTAPTVIEA